VVTGGGQGIGLEIARTFLANGATVLLGDINAEAAEKSAAELTSGGDWPGTAAGMRCDVTSEEEVDALVRRAAEQFGSVDVMVNNAGITRDATMRKMSIEDFRAVLDVHLVGSWLGTRAAGAVMREQKRGSIVNISSISGKVGLIGQTNYSAAKAGMVGLTKAAAKELAYLGVRVNAIQPGLIRTAMTEALREDVWQQNFPRFRWAGRPNRPRWAAWPCSWPATCPAT
jgi:3-oxoacyl-[acyl-carrier protein] reductase